MKVYLCHTGYYERRQLQAAYLSEADLSAAAWEAAVGMPARPTWDPEAPSDLNHARLNAWGEAAGQRVAELGFASASIAHAHWIANHPEATRIEWEEIG